MISAVTPTRLITDITRLSMMFTSVVSDQQDHAEDRRVGRAVRRGRRGVGADQLEAGPDRRQHHLQRERRRGDHDDLPDHHDPAGEPAEGGVRKAGGPLVDRARDRIARGQFREAGATSSCPTSTAGQVQKKTGPPNAYPKAKNWKTVVRTEMKENPAAKEAYRPRLRCSSWW